MDCRKARLGDAPQITRFNCQLASETERRRLNRALDALADRFGDDAVRRASQAEIKHATLSGQWKKGSRETDGPGE